MGRRKENGTAVADIGNRLIHIYRARRLECGVADCFVDLSIDIYRAASGAHTERAGGGIDPRG